MLLDKESLTFPPALIHSSADCKGKTYRNLSFEKATSFFTLFFCASSHIHVIMLLTKEAIQTITLNAKFVHKYADQVFFTSELNSAAGRLGDQPFLNFFVRYHHRDAPERYSWSRVRRVVLLEDAIAEAKRNGTAPPCASATIEWRGKTVWICLAVEPVQSSSAMAAEEVEEELVMLPQLSNTVPEEDEVLAFCVSSANLRSTEQYVDGVLGDAPAVPTVLPEATNAVDVDGHGVAGEVAQPPASLNPRIFVPTPRQVELLRQYKKQHFTHHQWVEEEIEASKALRRRYSSIGVAAAPVRTVTYEHEQRVVERKKRPATASPVEDVEVTQNPLYVSESDPALLTDAGTYPTTQTQRSTLSAVPPTSPSAVSGNDTPLSPFLPRGILRHQQQGRGTATAFAGRVPTDDLVSETLLGAGSPLSSFSQLNVSQTPPPLTPDLADQSGDIDDKTSSSQGRAPASALSQHLSQLRATQDSFYRYISDEKRSHYLNRLANITLRNSETNAQSRRRGIANERRLERKGNLLESRGLWITDDKERAKQAEDYVKSSSSGLSESTKNDDKAASKNAAVGSGTNESSDKARSGEEVFAEKFKAYHAAQRISFATYAEDDDDLLAGTDPDVDPLLLQAAAVEPNAAGDGAVRVTRRAVRRLLPNRLNTEEASPALVQAQLVHRSTLRMAKRGRDE